MVFLAMESEFAADASMNGSGCESVGWQANKHSNKEKHARFRNMSLS
jgi:hypothetical protein